MAGGQDYEVGYEAGKMRKSRSTVKKAVKKVGNSRKRVDKKDGLSENAYDRHESGRSSARSRQRAATAKPARRRS